jgi:hypothetical protein
MELRARPTCRRNKMLRTALMLSAALMLSVSASVQAQDAEQKISPPAASAPVTHGDQDQAKAHDADSHEAAAATQANPSAANQPHEGQLKADHSAQTQDADEGDQVAQSPAPTTDQSSSPQIQGGPAAGAPDELAPARPSPAPNPANGSSSYPGGGQTHPESQPNQKGEASSPQ